MPPKNKASAKASKKGKALKKSSTPTAPSDHESDWTAGDDEHSVKDMFNNMTAMMPSLSTHMDEMEGGGRKKRKVAFHGDPPARQMLAQAPEMASQPDSAPAAMTYHHCRLNLTAVKRDWHQPPCDPAAIAPHGQPPVT